MPLRKFSSQRTEIFIEVPQNIFESMMAICQKSPEIETGSILVGRYSHDGKVAKIQEVLPPSTDSVGTITTFRRGVLGLSKTLVSRWNSTGSHYLGEWHYHPLGNGQPSDTDIGQMLTFARKESMQSPVPIMIIIFRRVDNQYDLRAFVFTREGLTEELSLSVEGSN